MSFQDIEKVAFDIEKAFILKYTSRPLYRASTRDTLRSMKKKKEADTRLGSARPERGLFLDIPRGTRDTLCEKSSS